MKTTILLATALLASSISSASASTVTLAPDISYTVTIGVEAPNNVFASAPLTSGYIETLNLSIGKVSLDGARIVTDDTKNAFGGVAATPGFVDSGEHYLAVYGNNEGFNHTGSAVFSLTKPATSVSFNWGSIDDYNIFQFSDAKLNFFTLHGSDIQKALDSGIANEALFTLNDPFGITWMAFGSTYNSFEAANLSVSTVPLPGALLFFGTGLASLTGLARRKKA